jgi:hypothetical protein
MHIQKRTNRKKPFSVEFLDGLRPQGDGAVEWRDGNPGRVSTGLVARVEKSGIVSLYATYKVARAKKPPRRTFLARWDGKPNTLIDAKQRALALVENARLGVDPEPERDAPKVKEWKKDIAHYVPLFLEHGTKNAANFAPRLRDEIVSRWGDREPSELPEGEFLEILWAYVEDGKPARGRTLRDATRAFYNWLNERHRLRLHNPGNVGRQLAAALRQTANKYRAYTDNELAKVWKAADEWPQLRLAMLTGVRSDTIPKIRRDWINGETFNLVADPDAPQEVRKRVPPTLPVTPAIRELLDARPSDADPVFAKQPSNAAMNARAGTEQHVKALKKTTATRLAALGVQQDVIDYLQGHSLAGSRARYNTHRYIDEARDALLKYEHHLQDIINK